MKMTELKATSLIIAKNFNRAYNLNSLVMSVMNFVVSCDLSKFMVGP